MERSSTISLAIPRYANRIHPADTPFLTRATNEYARIIERDGAKIIQALQQHTGLSFLEQPIPAFVVRGRTSNAGSPATGSPIYLAAHVEDEHFGRILTHELGHRLLAQRRIESSLSPHQMLYLFLYQVWETVFGKKKAQRFLEIEKKNIARSSQDNLPYSQAWKWALALSDGERQQYLEEIRINSTPINFK